MSHAIMSDNEYLLALRSYYYYDFRSFVLVIGLVGLVVIAILLLLYIPLKK